MPKISNVFAWVFVALAAVSAVASGYAAEPQRPRLNLTMQPIDYPIEALAAAEEGTTLVELGIGVDGAVTDVVLQQSSGSSRLDDAGIHAARSLKLSSPPMRGGVPVAARLPAEIVWKLPATLAEKYFAISDQLTRTVDEEIRRINGGQKPENIRPPRPFGRGNRINSNSYPAESVRRNEMGRATFATHIGIDGSVVETYLVGSSGFERLDQWAINEVRKFRYEPARLGDVPVPSIAMQRLSFLLNGAQLSNCEANPLITRSDRRTR